MVSRGSDVRSSSVGGAGAALASRVWGSTDSRELLGSMQGASRHPAADAKSGKWNVWTPGSSKAAEPRSRSTEKARAVSRSPPRRKASRKLEKEGFERVRERMLKHTRCSQTVVLSGTTV